jgi:HlyD family secretion protein
MAKLDQQTQQARRDRILDAAERCFVHRGFHRSSMHDICREAGISPGALYIYFASKEELIAGLCERETVQFVEHFGQLRDAPDFMAALRGLAEHYCFSQPQEKLRLHIEIGAEAGRNETVRARVLEIDAFVARRFEELIDRLREDGRIAPSVDSAVLSRILSIVGDGLFWHRALNPEFDTRAVLPALMTMIETLINPVNASSSPAAKAAPSGKKTMKKTKLLPLLAVLMAGSGIAALPAVTSCHAEAVAAAQVSQAPSVSVTAARRTTLTETILVTGSLVAREEVLVTPQIDGLRLMEVHAEQGDRVKKGQLLARLDRTTLDAQLARLEAQDKRSDAAIAQARNQILTAEATVKQATAAFQRTADLLKTGASTQASFEEREAASRSANSTLAAAKDGLQLAEADKVANQAQIREAKLKLAFTEIAAPADGIISRRTAKVGATTSGMGDALFRIVEKGDVELDAEIPELHLPNLKTGMAARVQVAGLPEKKGTLRLISPEIDKATRLGRVRILLGDDITLRVGAFARGQIETARSEGLAVPAGAVMHNSAGSFVQVVRDEKVETRAVRTGMRSDSLVEIVDGLKEGEKVVARSGTLLREGDTVRSVLTPLSEAR